jgi:hypothetical protein
MARHALCFLVLLALPAALAWGATRKPDISYSPSSVTLTVGTAMTPLAPANTGGTVATWSISPALSAGLSFDTATGVISGTPTEAMTAKTYTVKATNAGGSSTATVTITVDALPPVISYSPGTFVFTKNKTIAPISPTSTGGAVVSWSVDPALPPGLGFAARTGKITGRPTVISPEQTYTVTAANSGGAATATLTITVNDKAPAFHYTPAAETFTIDTTIAPLTPVSTGGTVVTWSISPDLGPGLDFSPSTGQITGTPTAVQARTTYTVTGTNTGGTGTATLAITVNDLPPVISYTPSTYVFTVGTRIAAIVPTRRGGAVDSWSISPGLPAGLDFDTANGRITGTPAAAAATAVYTVTASNGVGSSQAGLTITVNVPTMTVTGTVMVNYLPYDTPTQTITPDPLPRSNVTGIQALAGGLTYPGTFNASTGAYSIPNVPVGWYTLELLANRVFTVWTNQQTVSWSYYQQGRSTVSYPTETTDVMFDTSNMTPWTVNDWCYTVFFDANSYLYAEPDTVCYEGYPNVGDTVLSMGVDWYANGLPLVDTTQGDAPIFTQMVDTTPPGPSHLVTSQNSYLPSPLTIVNGNGATIGGSFTAIPQTSSVVVNYNCSDFASYRSDFNAAATHRSPHFEVDDSPGLSTYYQNNSNWMDRLWYINPSSTANVNLGTVPMPPVWPGFERIYYAGQHSYLNYQLPGTSNPAFTTWNSIYAHTLTPPTATTPIIPVVSHPRALAINGTSMLTGAGILATGVGTTPTFTWQAPALGTPTGYQVDVFHVYASGSYTHVSGSILRMFTTDTQVQCPPGVLVSGNYYIFEVLAIYDSTYSLTSAPFQWGISSYSTARNVTGIFAP